MVLGSLQTNTYQISYRMKIVSFTNSENFFSILNAFRLPRYFTSWGLPSQVYPPCEHPVAHDKDNLVTAGKSRGQHDRCFRLTDNRGIYHRLILILYI